MKSKRLIHDERAAATELGYIFTFLLGVLLLTMFSLWAVSYTHLTLPTILLV